MGKGICESEMEELVPEVHLVVFIAVQNFVGIDAAVLTICTFFHFSSLA